MSHPTDPRSKAAPLDWVSQYAQDTPNQIAIIDGETRLSYAELDKQITLMSGGLQAANVKPGDAVATLLPNSWEMIVVLLATLRCGAVSLPINPQYRHDEVGSTLEKARPTVIFSSGSQNPIVDEVLARIGREGVTCFSVTEVSDPWRPYSESLKSQAAFIPPHKIDDSDPALWLYSSGSTGNSKKISRTRAQLAAEAVAFHQTTDTNAADVVLCTVPLSHAHGYGNGLMAALYVGATLVVHERFDRRRFLESVEAERVSIVPGSPFMFKILSETKMKREPDLGSIRLCITGGAPLTRETYETCQQRFGISIRQLYGSTETGAVSLNLSEDLDATWDSVGRPLHGTQVGVFGEDGSLLPAEQEGVIGISTPAMFDGYEIDELNETALKGGYFFPGDRGRLDASGHVYITGRDTLFINLGGNKVDPSEVEALLEQHPKVVESVVLGTQAQRGNEMVKAVVVTSEPCEAAELLEFCRGRIADFKLPRIIEFREEIPRNPLGKVLRKYLQ